MIDLKDLYIIFFTFFYIVIVSFWTYSPLFFFTKKHSLAQVFSVPISLSLFIFIGYPLYSFHQLKYFPLLSGLIIIIVNIVFFILNKNSSNFSFRFPSKKNIILTILLLIPLIYSRFYDSFSTLSPGHADTFYHIDYLKGLFNKGAFPVTFYAPGFHLVLYPLFTFLGTSIYRFTGPILGLLIVYQLYIIFSQKLSKKGTAIAILLFCNPIFNFLIQQTISFWPTILSYIYFLIFLYFLSIPPGSISSKLTFYLTLIISLSMAVTVPYFFIQLCPVLFLLSLITFFAKKIFSKTYFNQVLLITFISFVGLGFSFIHVVLQSSVFNKKGSFPEIPYTIVTDGQTVNTTNYQIVNVTSPSQIAKLTTTTSDNKTSIVLSTINTLLERYILPSFGSLIEIVKTKGVRPITDLSSLKTNVWILVSLVLFPMALFKKDRYLYIISFFGILFGILSQTGLFEIGTYRGRVSIYFLFLPLLTLPYIYHRIKTRITPQFTYLGIIVLYFLSFVKPPYFFRDYCPEIVDYTKSIISLFPDKEVRIVSETYQASLVSDNITTLAFNYDNFQKSIYHNPSYLVINKQKCNFTPEVFKQASKTDINYLKYLTDQNQNDSQIQKTIDDIRSSPEFSKFTQVWENPNVIIYLKKFL